MACLPRPLVADTDSQAPLDTDPGPLDIADLDPSVLPAGPDPCRTPVLVRVDEVTDGDTVRVEPIGGGVGETVRIIGVDTPEIGYGGEPDDCWAQEATGFTRDLLQGERAWLTFDGECIDNFDRTLAYVHTGAEQEDFVDWLLLRRGHGRPLAIAPNTTFRAELELASRDARSEDLGLWAACP